MVPIALCRDLDGLKIAGCPKGIQNKKYDRNAFIFNFCFVFEGDCDITPYEGVIRKVGASFKEYEVDSDFLKDEKTRKNIPEILRKVLYQLNTRGYCHVPIGNVCPGPTTSVLITLFYSAR